MGAVLASEQLALAKGLGQPHSQRGEVSGFEVFPTAPLIPSFPVAPTTGGTTASNPGIGFLEPFAGLRAAHLSLVASLSAEMDPHKNVLAEAGHSKSRCIGKISSLDSAAISAWVATAH